MFPTSFLILSLSSPSLSHSITQKLRENIWGSTTLDFLVLISFIPTFLPVIFHWYGTYSLAVVLDSYLYFIFISLNAFLWLILNSLWNLEAILPPPRDNWQCLEIFVFVITYRGETTGLWWVEISCSVKLPVMHRTASSWEKMFW